MTTPQGRIYLAVGLILVCGFVFVAGALAIGAWGALSRTIRPTPDFAGTLQALVTSGAVPTSTPEVSHSGATVTAASAGGQLSGHIVLTCLIYKYQSSEQICIMNADGSAYHRLTTEDGVRHWYSSLAPDGRSIVYSQYREDNVYEIYELTLADGVVARLTDRLGTLTGPEISPDAKSIVFMRWTLASNQEQVWLMDRDGSNPRSVFKGKGWDPTWSPDGTRILFASDIDGSNQLYVVNLDGTGLHKITNLPALRGRSDWSPQNEIVTYSGDSWKRELFLMNADGSDVHQISPPGGNSQGPAFSPDGQWIAFTAYFDRMNDDNGCEIYVIRTDGSDLRRLTNNDYCDYQPRWGP
jgi:Tol biopolymer transport system component